MPLVVFTHSKHLVWEGTKGPRSLSEGRGPDPLLNNKMKKIILTAATEDGTLLDRQEVWVDDKCRTLECLQIITDVDYLGKTSVAELIIGI